MKRTLLLSYSVCQLFTIYFITPNVAQDLKTACAKTPDEGKIDCFPGVAEEGLCTGKGCCWHILDEPGPWCYYPSTYKFSNVLQSACANISTAKKRDCLPGANEEPCLAKGCCWHPKNEPGPWCYYPKTVDFSSVLKPECANIPNYNKIDCLPGNGDEGSCKLKGCCYHQISEPGPWCYYPKTFDFNRILKPECAYFPNKDKVDCLPGADETSCTAKGCCWHKINEPERPWCYYPKTYNLSNFCPNVPNEQKVDCLSGADERSCNAKGCCWFENPLPGPWCYFPKTYHLDQLCGAVPNEARVDCFPGADKKSCLSKGCCWQQKDDTGSSCFYPQVINPQPHCSSVPNEERIDCLAGAGETSCIAKGCCWSPRPLPSVWCFHPKTRNLKNFCLNVPDETKVDCLPGGDEKGCVSKGCCWLQRSDPGVPRCFYPKMYNTKSFCANVPNEEKVDCFPGTGDENACTSKGCCWFPLDIPGPWCYYPKTYDLKPFCESMPIEERFDCLPGADEKACISKGCCWSPLTVIGPWCFYPKNFRPFVLSDISFDPPCASSSTNGIRGQRLLCKGGQLGFRAPPSLNSTFKSPAYLQLTLDLTLPQFYRYPSVIETARVVIHHETKSRLRIYITDDKRERFRPPQPEVPDTNIFKGDADYEVLVKGDPFGLAVVRKSTQKVIFDTRGIGGLTLADQFLQISSSLPTKYIYGPGERGNNLYISPSFFYIANNLYGILSGNSFYLGVENDGSSFGIFLLNSNAMDIIVQPKPAITFRTIGGILDFYFFLGPTPADVIKQYLEVIGYPALPPYWSLGFHLSKWGLKTLNAIDAVWKRNRNARIPFDGFWSDIDYMDGYKNFILGSNYKNLPSLVSELHKAEMKYITNLDAGIPSKLSRGGYPPYDEGIKENIFITNAFGLPSEGKAWNNPSGTVYPDFSNPKTEAYWLKLLSTLHEKISYDGLWLTMDGFTNPQSGASNNCPNNPLNNPHFSPQLLHSHSLCMSDKYAIGSHYDVHRIYGLLECLTTYPCLQKITKKRPFLLTTSAFPGTGHYAAYVIRNSVSTWAKMKQSIKDIIIFNMFGIPMVGSDICGSNGGTTKELCQRWSQLGAFYPFSRNHNSADIVDQDPAAWDESFLKSTKKALDMRYRLLPYLYTLFYRAHQFGETVIRPLFFDFPADENTLSIDTQFMWGPALLISPVLTQGATSVKAFFPKGIWVNIEKPEDKIDSKGEYRTIPAPLDTIPVYMRGGYIIPWQIAGVTTSESRKNDLGLSVILNEERKASGSLFWDDGESFLYKDDSQYNLLEFSCTSSILTITATHWSYNVTMKLNEIIIYGVPSQVNYLKVNDREHQHFSQTSKTKMLVIRQLNAISLSSPVRIMWSARKNTFIVGD